MVNEGAKRGARVQDDELEFCSCSKFFFSAALRKFPQLAMAGSGTNSSPVTACLAG
jgi:hypothetical protein